MSELTLNQKKAIRAAFKSDPLSPEEIVGRLQKLIPKSSPYRPSVPWLNNVMYGSKRCSPERAKLIERATEKRITKELLRPDIYC